jgi:exosortase
LPDPANAVFVHSKAVRPRPTHSITPSPGDPTLNRNGESIRNWSTRIVLGFDALLLAVAYRHFVRPEPPSVGLEQELESWFFVPGHGNGPIVLGLALWVLYRRWPALRSLPYRSGPALAIALCFAVGAAIMAWATYARAADLLAPSLAFTCLGLATLRGGARACQLGTLPLVMLLCAIQLPAPLYNTIVWKAQLWAASYGGWLLNLVGVQATVSADLIFQDRHVVSVIEGCSGLRSAEILLLLALLMKELFQLRTWEAWVLCLLTPLLAFVLNGLRVAGIAMLPNPEQAIQHAGQGILTLIGGCLLLFGVVVLLERLRSDASPVEAPNAPAGEPAHPSRQQLAWGTALIALLAILSVALKPPALAPRSLPDIEELIPTRVARLESSQLEVPWRFLGQTLFMTALHRRYERPNAPKGSEIELFVGIGARADRRFSSLSKKTALLGSGWVEEDWSQREALFEGAMLDVVVIRAGTARRLVHRFTAGDLGLARESLRAFSGVEATPHGSAPDEVIVRLSTPLRNGRMSERRRASAYLADFTQALREPLRQLLSGTPPAKPQQEPREPLS